MVTHNVRIIRALLHRDLKVLSSQLVSRFIDGIIIVGLQIVEFCYLLPIMGLSAQLIGPLFLGTLVLIIFHMGFSMSLRHLHDLHSDRFIDYQITLPLRWQWLLISYIIFFIIEVSIIAIPLLATAILFFKSQFGIIHINFLALPFIYLISLIFLGLVFLYLPFAYSFEWFNDNIWPRRLSPLLMLSSSFLPWKQVHAFAPIIGQALLLNPLTYVADGLRSALIGGPDFIPVWRCIFILSIVTVILITIFMIQTKRRLDIV